MRSITPCYLLYYLFLLLILPTSGTLVQAQEFSQADSAYWALNEDYRKHHLYRGREFLVDFSVSGGSPNHANLPLLDDCTLVYDGVFYDRVPLMYNLVEDILITAHPESSVYLILEKHLVSEFHLGEDSFVRIDKDHPDLAPGIYQEIYKSDGFACYAKRNKSIKIQSSGSAMETRYVETVVFYLDDLSTAEGFQVIRRHRDLLNLDRSERRAIRTLMNRADVRFRSQPEKSLITVLGYLDQIKKSSK